MHRVLSEARRGRASPRSRSAPNALTPAPGGGRPLEDVVPLVLAEGVTGPGIDAAAARVLLGVDVDGDAEEVVRDLRTPVGVGGAEAADRLRRVAAPLAGARPLDVLVDAGERGGDLGVDRDRHALEADGLRLRLRALGVVLGRHVVVDVAVVLGHVAQRAVVLARIEPGLVDEGPPLEELLRGLDAAAALEDALGPAARALLRVGGALVRIPGAEREQARRGAHGRAHQPPPVTVRVRHRASPCIAAAGRRCQIHGPHRAKRSQPASIAAPSASKVSSISTTGGGQYRSGSSFPAGVRRPITSVPSAATPSTVTCVAGSAPRNRAPVTASIVQPPRSASSAIRCAGPAEGASRTTKLSCTPPKPCSAPGGGNASRAAASTG